MTDDGYINSVMRIPGPKGYIPNNLKEEKDEQKKPVVIY